MLVAFEPTHGIAGALPDGLPQPAKPGRECGGRAAAPAGRPLRLWLVLVLLLAACGDTLNDRLNTWISQPYSVLEKQWGEPSSQILLPSGVRLVHYQGYNSNGLASCVMQFRVGRDGIIVAYQHGCYQTGVWSPDNRPPERPNFKKQETGKVL